jgi:hypothetical protein
MIQGSIVIHVMYRIVMSVKHQIINVIPVLQDIIYKIRGVSAKVVISSLIVTAVKAAMLAKNVKRAIINQKMVKVVFPATNSDLIVIFAVHQENASVAKEDISIMVGMENAPNALNSVGYVLQKKIA